MQKKRAGKYGWAKFKGVQSKKINHTLKAMKRQKGHEADCDHKKLKVQSHFKYEHEAKPN